jgi:uncharacterized membrane protein
MSSYHAKNIAEYLEFLKIALKGADVALIRDALYDAEEYLRSELAANPTLSEAELLASVVNSYGAPEEVANLYRDTEMTVQKALQPPRKHVSGSKFKQFFAVAADPHTYGALFYMLISMVTGIFYFTWVSVGFSLSVGLLILIIGIPFFILFMASIYAISLAESRLLETLLGVRMPRRPVYQGKHRSWLSRIKDLLTDPRTWLSLMYMVLMMPLGIVYFTIAISLMAISVACIAAPLGIWLNQLGLFNVANASHMDIHPAYSPLVFVSGIVLYFASLHLIRAIGQWHGRFAKHVLVKAGAD